ncbi:TorF family putative porin [Pseudomonas poae]|uniref:DUF481 domain-containing protein n=1 Tax=Pseudomonas poae TaxID=200451 RepID=A0ABY0RBV0_9PSED|nr:TorF family putative porin [Pseudomonas poae]KRP45163.1 hypothetical protein TU75_20845 [Pseudomonas poae]SDN56048.1 protein of unknown function (Gcw_chp) [Pseudomonas poae]
MRATTHHCLMAALLWPIVSPSLAFADEMASYAIDVTAKAVSDVRTRGVSDSLNHPGARVTVQFAHESGLVALAEFTTVSKKQFIDGDGVGVLLAGGYRFGDPEAWHYGLGLAAEMFPGAQFKAPNKFDFETFTPTDERTTNYNSQFAVLEVGYGALEGRVARVLSKTYRGANTGGVCGAQLQFRDDPTKGLECYAKGDRNSRGSMLYDLDYKYALGMNTTLKLHAGYQQFVNFSEADATDYDIGLSHRWLGLDWGIDWIAVKTKARELYMVEDDGHVRSTDDNRWVASISRTF